MNYIIETKSIGLLNNKITSIMEQNSIDLDDVYRFDFLEENNFEKILSTYFSESIFNNKKIIILRNPVFLNDSKKNKEIEKILIQINSFKTDNILIFYLETLKKDNKYIQQINDNFEIVRLKIPIKNELEKYVIDELNKKNISYDTKIIKPLISRLNSNFDLINNEIEKMSLVNKKIDLNFLELNQYDLKGENIFLLVNYIITKDFEKIEKNIDKLKAQSFSPVLIVEILVNELSLILQLMIAKKYHQNGNMKNNEFIENSYRLMMIERNMKNASIEALKFIYNELFELLITLKTKQRINEYTIIKSKLLFLIKSN